MGSENGKYRPAMQKWLTETAAGTVKDPTGTPPEGARAPWSLWAVKPMIEHYVGMEMPDVDTAYQAYVRLIASEELAAHWRGS